MAIFGIVSGSGFTGAAQFISGSTYEGISLGTLTSGSKYDISFDYISSAPLNVYSGDYSDKFIVTQYPSSAITVNTGSIKSWSGEFLAVYDKENFLGLGSDGWFAVDRLRVKPIPNLVTNGTFDSSAGWSTPQQSSITGGVLSINHTSGIYVDYTARGVSRLVLGKRYMISFEIKNYIQGDVSVNVGGNTAIAGQSGNGVKNVPLTIAYDNNATIYFSAVSPFNFVGDVDNIHIYEIPEWTASGNHTGDISILDKSGTTGTQSYKITASGAGRGAELVTNGDFSSVTGNIGTGWEQTYAGQTTSIVTGNGFTGNAQRVEHTGTDGSLFRRPSGLTLTAGKLYEISFNYRYNKAGASNLRFGTGNQATAFSIAVSNTGNAVAFRTQFTAITSDYFSINIGSSSLGAWYEIDDISIKEVLGEVSLPSANLESCVSGKKYTLEGFARLDASSLGYAETIINHDFATNQTGTYTTANATKTWDNVNGLMKIVSTTSSTFGINIGGFWTTHSGKIVKVSFKAKSTNSTNSFFYNAFGLIHTIISNPNLNTSWQDYSAYIYNNSATQLSLYAANNGFVGEEIEYDNFVITAAVAPTLTAQLGTKSVTSSALSIVAGTFTKFVLNFEATASEQSQDLKLYLSGAGNVFVDKLSLTQAYDMIRCYKFKVTNDEILNDATLLMGGGVGAPLAGGLWTYINLTNNTIRLTAQSTDYLNSAGVNSSAITRNSVINSVDYINRTSSMNIYINGVIGGTAAFTTVGKIINSHTDYYFKIGTWASSLTTKYKGLISHVQIWRFENISLSTFNSAITGLQYPTGGGAEEVLRQDWSMISGNIAYDQSPKANNLTGYGVINAATNVITTKEYVIQPDKLIQATDVSRPLYVSDSFWEFDGTNDFLYPTGSLGLIKEYYIKFKPDALNATKSLANFNVTSSLFMSSSNLMFMTGSTFATMSLYSSSLATVPNVISSDWNILHASDATGVEANQFKLGFSSTYWDGAIQRFVAYDRQLSDNDKNRLLRSLSF